MSSVPEKIAVCVQESVVRVEMEEPPRTRSSTAFQPIEDEIQGLVRISGGRFGMRALSPEGVIDYIEPPKRASDEDIRAMATMVGLSVC